MALPSWSHDRKCFYKYMTADVAKLVLQNNTLRWALQKLFNDPFDVQFDLRVEYDRGSGRERGCEQRGIGGMAIMGLVPMAPMTPMLYRPHGGDEILSRSRDRIAVCSLKLGGHLVDASLGAVVVLARRPGHANRTDHVVADLNWQTAG